jgi:predicted dehydrogenase
MKGPSIMMTSSATTAPCRWGILGTAGIARRNWQAIRDAGNARLVAVASREAARAADFIAACQRQAPHPVEPEGVGGYEALLARPDIDAVYLPLPTVPRKEWVLRAAAAGTHVLVEKPVGASAADVAEMLAACQKHRVQFMDGVMFMHGRRLKELRSVVDGELGRLRHIASQFSFLADEAFLRTNIRSSAALEPLGCLGDLGWYSLRFTLWAMRETLPKRVKGRIHAEAAADGGPAVPFAFTGMLEFPGGVTATFHCSFLAGHAQWATVSGERGYLQLADFVLPFAGRQTEYTLTRSRFDVDGCQFDMHSGREVVRVEESANNAPDSQEAALFAEFSRLATSGTVDPSWGRASLATQQVLDACLASARSGEPQEPPRPT